MDNTVIVRANFSEKVLNVLVLQIKALKCCVILAINIIYNFNRVYIH